MKKLILGLSVLGLLITGIAYAATLQGFQGGTGFATTTAGNVGNFLQVASTTPFLTYTYAAGGTGSFTTTSIYAVGTSTATKFIFASSSPALSIACDGTQTCTWTLPTSTASQTGLLTSGDWTTFNSKVGTARQVLAGSGLLGGGNLSADVTLYLNSVISTSSFTTATSTNFYFSFATGTTLGAGTICLTSDTCRTTWPTSGAVTYPLYTTTKNNTFEGITISPTSSITLASTSVVYPLIGGSILRDATSSYDIAGATTTFSFLHTATTTANSFLFCTFTANSVGPSINTVSYAGTLMTFLASSTVDSGRALSGFYTRNPASGTNTVVATSSASTNPATGACVSYAHVKQTAPETNNFATTSASTFTASTSVTTTFPWIVLGGRNGQGNTIQTGSGNVIITDNGDGNFMADQGPYSLATSSQLLMTVNRTVGGAGFGGVTISMFADQVNTTSSALLISSPKSTSTLVLAGNGGSVSIDTHLITATTSLAVPFVSGTLATYDQYGFEFTTGTTPYLSTCGGGTPTIQGNNTAGFVTVGSGSLGTCTINFTTLNPRPLGGTITSTSSTEPIAISSISSSSAVISWPTSTVNGNFYYHFFTY